MLRVGALQLFNEPKDSVAVTLRDLTHDAKRLAPFDVTQLPRAGVGGKDGGLCLWSVLSCVTFAKSPIHAHEQAFDRQEMKRCVMNLTLNSV